MAKLICSSATTVCSGSQAGLPVPFSVGGGSGVQAGGAEVAALRDNRPMVNIGSFGVCKLFNPPKPCVPVLTDPYRNEASKVLIGNSPALTDSSTLRCKQGGVISFRNAGQSSVEVN